jgi:hypothetical protein
LNIKKNFKQINNEKSISTPSFKFETNIAKYDAEYVDYRIDAEHWHVIVTYKCSENVSGQFKLPITWSREYVFGWLSRLEINEIGKE